MKVGEGARIYETAKIVDRGSWGPAEITIGKNCLIGDFAFVAARKLEMMDGSQIGPHASVTGGGEVTLDRLSVVGYGVRLISGTYSTRGEYMCEAGPPEKRRLIIGSITLMEGAYIGANSVICVSERCRDIVIGPHAVVGALTYIDESVPPRTVIYPKKNYVEKRRPRP